MTIDDATMDDGSDRSTIEIKHLLYKLNPGNQGGHKDRVRTLSRFRNYVAGDGAGTKKGGKVTTPAFYDDDLPLLFLGAEAPPELYDDDVYGDLSNYYGLLQACSTPSTDHAGELKRSARNAMNLLKYLAIDYVEMKNGEPITVGIDAATGKEELNPFAYSLCSLSISELRMANFDLHLKETSYSSTEANKRSGAKTDACQMLVLLLTRHFDPEADVAEKAKSTGPTIVPEDLLLTSVARQSFENWMVQNVDKETQNFIKMASISRKEGKNTMNGDPFSNEEIEIDADILSSFKKKPEFISSEEKEAMAEAEAHAVERLDQLGLNLYNKNVLMGNGTTSHTATAWRDSELASSKYASAEEGKKRQIDREKSEHDANAGMKMAERQKLIGRDPLGIRPDTFELHSVQERQLELLNQGIQDLAEEMIDMGIIDKSADEDKKKRKHRDNFAYSLDQLVSLKGQKSALEKVLTGHDKEGETISEKKGDAIKENYQPSAAESSILPVDPNFNPLLFLTLVHRNTSFEQLQESIARLSNQSDDQKQRLQDLVKENFSLFISCADGIDLFSDRAGKGKTAGPGVHQRLDTLDTLSKSCSDQAKKSFKPLLDNTNQVRKVQSALRVLERVGPLLQVPSLMRQHVKNGRFSDAVKAYRRVLVIEDDSRIELLRHVKLKAIEAARGARQDLECRLTDPSMPVQSILDSLRDLDELIELQIPMGTKEAPSKIPEGVTFAGDESTGAVFQVGEAKISIRQHAPSLACLLLQAAHFSKIVQDLIAFAETSTTRIYEGESLSAIVEDADFIPGDEKTTASTPSLGGDSKHNGEKRERNRWKYDVLEARVLAAFRSVAIARTWLPRLLTIAEAARRSERRRVALQSRNYREETGEGEQLTAFEVFISEISPSVKLLVQHAAFLGLGCRNSDGDQDLTATFGLKSEEKLFKLLQSPLPATQSSKCAVELAVLSDVVQSIAVSTALLKPSESDLGITSPSSRHQRFTIESVLDEITSLSEEAVVTIERRKCIYTFDQCARSCSMRSSGSGVLDCNATLTCVQQLSEELTRQENCAAEIEKGCELVVRKCCEGLGSYVRDRGDSARLRVVSECATALDGSIVGIVQEVSYLTNCPNNLEDSLLDDVISLESLMFDEFLDSIRRNISSYTHLGPMEGSDDDEFTYEKKFVPGFPAYLSASLLAIVRCRAQVEKSLGEKTIRKGQGVSYKFLAMSTAADSVVDGICFEISERLSRMRSWQAERYMNELQFLMNTLRRYLGDNVLNDAEDCKKKLFQRTGGDFQGNSPDGLMAIEELERLGRVYVLCLSE